MNIESRLEAIDALTKRAQATTAIRPGVAFKDLTPQEQAQRRDEYKQRRIQNGKDMMARGLKTDTSPSLGDYWNGVKDVATDADEWKKTGKNVLSGVGSMALGAAKGIASLPGDAVGLTNGIWSKLHGGSFGEGYEAGKKGTEDLLGISSLNDMIDSGQNRIMSDYTQRNGIDPTDENDTLGRLGMKGLDISHGAGRAVGEWKSPGLYGKAFKAIPKAITAVHKPMEALKAGTKAIRQMPGAMRQAQQARKATSRMLGNNGLRRSYINRFQKSVNKGIKPTPQMKSTYQQALRKDMGFLPYHSQGLLWKAPLAYGINRLSTMDDQGNNYVDNAVENANFWKDQRATGTPPTSAGSSSVANTAIDQMANGTPDAYSDNDLSYYLER